jgi:hypothetical protein
VLRRTGFRSVPASGLRRVALLVPGHCATAFRELAREVRARRQAGLAGTRVGWRRLNRSAELMVDLRCCGRCLIRDTGASGADRYYWTVTVLADHQVAAGRAGEFAMRLTTG